jgi:lipoate-protein ligase A
VVLGPDTPALTLVEHSGGGDIAACYGRFCEALIAALGRLEVQAEFRSPADLAVGERKIAGLAQRRKRNAALVTASLLLGPMCGSAEKYLAVPAGRDAPEYRAGRGHEAFMTSLLELGVEAPRWRAAFEAELRERGAAAGRATPGEIERAALIEGQLAEPDWIYRF